MFAAVFFGCFFYTRIRHCSCNISLSSNVIVIEEQIKGVRVWIKHFWKNCTSVTA